MTIETTTIFELARTLWIVENVASLPTDAAERRAQWHAIKSEYIGKARALALQMEKRGLKLTCVAV